MSACCDSWSPHRQSLPWRFRAGWRSRPQHQLLTLERADYDAGFGRYLDASRTHAALCKLTSGRTVTLAEVWSVAVGVMHVGDVRMGVLQALVPMPMRMRFATWIASCVLMSDDARRAHVDGRAPSSRARARDGDVP